MLHRRHERILHGVVGIRGLTEHGERDSVCRTDVAFHERLERRGVAVLCTGDENGIWQLHGLLGWRARHHCVINA